MLGLSQNAGRPKGTYFLMRIRIGTYFENKIYSLHSFSLSDVKLKFSHFQFFKFLSIFTPNWMHRYKKYRLSLSLSLSHTHTHPLTITHIYPRSYSHIHSLPHIYSLSQTIYTRSLPPLYTLYLSHTPIYTLSLSKIHSFTSHIISLSLTHIHSLSNPY